MDEHMDAATAAKLHQAQVYQGRPPEDQLGFAGTLGDLLNERAASYPDKDYLIYYDENDERSRYTYARFRDEVHRTARYMAEALGLRRGERIATVAHNHAETLILYFAAWSLGLTVVPVNVGEDEPRIAFIMHNAECKVAFVRPDYLPRIAALREQVPTLGSIVQVGGAERRSGADRYLQGEVASFEGEFVPPEPVANTQEALIVYTSGTTGAPKGVMLNQYNLLVDARGILQWHEFTPDQRTMCVLPIHHVNGIVVTLLTPMLFGGSTVLNRAFSPRWFWQRAAAEGIQVVSVVPTLLAYLLDREQAQGDFAEYDLSRFRHFVCGAGPLTVQLGRAFEETFGIPIIHGYGLSETTCYSCFLPIHEDASAHAHWMRDFGYPSIGIPIEPNEMAIHDAEGNAATARPRATRGRSWCAATT